MNAEVYFEFPSQHFYKCYPLDKEYFASDWTSLYELSTPIERDYFLHFRMYWNKQLQLFCLLLFAIPVSTCCRCHNDRFTLFDLYL